MKQAKQLIQTNPAQASEEVGELLKGKNKKNVLYFSFIFMQEKTGL